MSLFSIRHLLSEEFGLIVTIADIVIGLVSLFFHQRGQESEIIFFCTSAD